MTKITEPRRFHLIRREDETGVSGTGVIVEGIEFTDGTVALRWLTGTTSTAVYASIDDVNTIHGHGGKTTIHWLDEEPAALAALRDQLAVEHAKSTAAADASHTEDARIAHSSIAAGLDIAIRWLDKHAQTNPEEN